VNNTNLAISSSYALSRLISLKVTSQEFRENFEKTGIFF